ncbi:jg6963 [Pararge aegeria aegeria]|uniref:Jg6963 protein n=1 Tax=Pararge aegeria aegeria TaxID=348720 RepID=A0A8S4SKD3_9NEOP|nr:jg6963 [Pararge aegeria aegeria]
MAETHKHISPDRSVNNVNQEPLAEDITAILQKVIEQIEIAKRNKETQETPIGARASNGSQVSDHMTTNSDLNNLQEMENVDENESKSNIFPNAQQSVDVLDTTNLDNSQSLGNLIKPDDSTTNQQTLEEITLPLDELLFTPSRRTANIETDDAERPTVIMDQITYKNKHNTEKNSKTRSNDIPKVLASPADYSTRATTTTESSKNLNENFDKVIKTINEIKKIHNKEQKNKLNNLVPQYRSAIQQINDNKPLSIIGQMLSRDQEPVIAQRTPWFHQTYPQTIIIKSPLFLESYPNHRHQHGLIHKTEKMLFRQVPVLVENVPKLFWTFLQ